MNTHKSRSFRLGRGLTKSSQPVEIGKNAARERSRVKSLRLAFQRLQSSLPTVPPDTKLSKLDVLILATNYISYLSNLLAESSQQSANESEIIIESKESQKEVGPKALHPIKKWPMRSRLYAGSKPNCSPSSVNNSISDSQDFSDNSFLLENIEPLLTEEWNPIDFDLLYDDLNSLSSFPNFSGTNH